MAPLSPELDADVSPSSSPSPSPLDPWDPESPLFQEATPPDMSSPLPPSSETLGTSQNVDPVGGSGSPPPSTRRNRKRELLATAAALVETVTGFAHEFLTAEGTVEREVGLYLADGADVKAISDPLAGLGSRRLPEGAENPDVADLVRLALGTAGYVMKQLRLRARIARTYAAAAEAEGTSQVDDEPAYTD